MLGARSWGQGAASWVLGAEFQKRDIGSRILGVGSASKMPQEVGWSCQSTGLGKPSRGSPARLPLSWNNEALAHECCAFSRRDFRAGSMQSPAWGHTEPDLHGPGVAQRQSRADGDGLPRPGCLILSPKLRMVRVVRVVRMVSRNNHSLSRAGDAQRCQPGFQGKPRCCEESSF